MILTQEQVNYAKALIKRNRELAAQVFGKSGVRQILEAAPGSMEVTIMAKGKSERKEPPPANWDQFVRQSAVKLIDEIEQEIDFYADKLKWFMRDTEVDMNQTTAIFKKAYRNKADLTKPNIFKSKVPECTARLKMDQGKRAQEVKKKISDWRRRMQDAWAYGPYGLGECHVPKEGLNEQQAQTDQDPA